MKKNVERQKGDPSGGDKLKLTFAKLPLKDPRFLLFALSFFLAAICLITSIFFPYWQLTLFAPQYPKGLRVGVYVNRVIGDISEIDRLNHYIGMRSLTEAAKIERSISLFAIPLIVILVLIAPFLHKYGWGIWLASPALIFPGVFLADLYLWLWFYGTNLDPTAALSSSVEPFVPTMLGKGTIGQFETVALTQTGFYLSVAGSLFILVGIYFYLKANSDPNVAKVNEE